MRAGTSQPAWCELSPSQYDGAGIRQTKMAETLRLTTTSHHRLLVNSVDYLLLVSCIMQLFADSVIY